MSHQTQIPTIALSTEHHEPLPQTPLPETSPDTSLEPSSEEPLSSESDQDSFFQVLMADRAKQTGSTNAGPSTS